MSAATVTRTVANPERSIGATLLVRTTRSVKLTEVGLKYLKDCRRMIAETDETEVQATHSGRLLAETGTDHVIQAEVRVATARMRSFIDFAINRLGSTDHVAV